MVTVKDLLKIKGHDVYTVAVDATVFEALKLMADKGVGALVVMAGEKLTGIISERDYARKIILKGKFSRDTLVREIMASKVICAQPDYTLEDCMALMTQRRVRHMPVLDSGRLLGIISIGDVVKAIISNRETTQAVINSLLRLSLEDIGFDQFLKRAVELMLSVPWLAFEKQGSIFLTENDSDLLVMKAQSGLSENIKVKCAQLPFGRCLCGRAAMTRELQFASGLDDRHEIRYEGIVPHGHYCVPIVHGEKVLGVINMYVRQGHKRDQREEAFLSAVANTLAGIIQRKRLERELVQTERLAAIGQTVAGIAHCVKGILFGLEGGVYVVNKALRIDDKDKLYTGWNMVQRNIDKVSALVFDLLSYSKERLPDYEYCSLNEIANEVVELMEPRVTHSSFGKIEMIRDFDPKIGKVRLDPKGIHRCLLNLVSNAIDACFYDPNEAKAHFIKVTTRREPDGGIMIQVSDNGCGMDKGIQKQLFTGLFSTKGSKGTGLGLPVTQKIVQEHGGILTVDSTPEKGSVFTISLPVDQKEDKTIFSKGGGYK
ncbi:MAG: CBS domain-containing protein [Deltaproteobacteria bacterium]|nr:CBS domain-containing protein [Deltaproteobacteria bacterium]MBW2152404.1 CBS domain-containing protein [Deltaproteobacteria bacterium]